MHKKFLHMYLKLNLIFILKLGEVNHILMTHYLVLIMSESIEEVGFVVTKSWIYNFELDQDT